MSDNDSAATLARTLIAGSDRQIASAIKASRRKFLIDLQDHGVTLPRIAGKIDEMLDSKDWRAQAFAVRVALSANGIGLDPDNGKQDGSSREELTIWRRIIKEGKNAEQKSDLIARLVREVPAFAGTADDPSGARGLLPPISELGASELVASHGVAGPQGDADSD